MKITGPNSFLFPKNITQPLPVYKRINLHSMVLMGVLWVIVLGLRCTYKNVTSNNLKTVKRNGLKTTLEI